MYVMPVQNATSTYRDIVSLFDIKAMTFTTQPRNLETIELVNPVTIEMRASYGVPFILFDGRRLNPWFAFFEPFWMWSAHDDVESLAAFVPSIAQFSDDGKIFHGAYGKRIAEQLGPMLDLLVRDPDSRRAVLTIYQSDKDCGVESKDIPCNTTVLLRIIKNRLRMTILRRSNDFVWGLPHNLIQFHFLAHAISRTLCLESFSVYHIINSLHLYIKDYGAKSNSSLYNLWTPNTTLSGVTHLPSGLSLGHLTFLGKLLIEHLDTKNRIFVRIPEFMTTAETFSPRDVFNFISSCMLPMMMSFNAYRCGDLDSFDAPKLVRYLYGLGLSKQHQDLYFLIGDFNGNRPKLGTGVTPYSGSEIVRLFHGGM